MTRFVLILTLSTSCFYSSPLRTFVSTADSLEAMAQRPSQGVWLCLCGRPGGSPRRARRIALSNVADTIAAIGLAGCNT